MVVRVTMKPETRRLFEASHADTTSPSSDSNELSVASNPHQPRFFDKPPKAEPEHISRNFWIDVCGGITLSSIAMAILSEYVDFPMLYVSHVSIQSPLSLLTMIAVAMKNGYIARLAEFLQMALIVFGCFLVLLTPLQLPGFYKNRYDSSDNLGYFFGFLKADAYKMENKTVIITLILYICWNVFLRKTTKLMFNLATAKKPKK